jgi:drug/metabolite transporter (DMT)-like permease
VTRRGWVLFIAMCVIWGIPYLLIKVAVREFSPASLVLARTALGALVLLPFAIRGDHLRPLVAQWRPLLAYTIIEIAIPWLLLNHAELKLSSSLTGLLIATVPLVGAVLARFTGKHERFHQQRAIGLFVGLVGVAALVGLDLSTIDLTAVALVMIVAVCYAIGPWILSNKLSDAPTLGVVASSLALTAFIYVPTGVAQLPSRFPSAEVVASVVTLAVVCTSLAFVLFLALISEIGPVRATVITYVNPAVAVVLGVTLLDESFSVGTGIGFALVLVGSYLATRRTPEPAPSEPTTVRADASAASGAGLPRLDSNQ